MPDPRSKTIVRSFSASLAIRALTWSEAPAAFDAVFAGLSPRSRFLRFHSPLPRLSPQLRESLTDLDGHRRVAVLAEAGGAPVGIAQFVATGPDEAEMAVAVVDAWQRRGVGTRLLTALTELATDLGYTRLTGSVLPENAAMLTLAARLAPWPRPTWDGEVVRVVLPLGPAAWSITDDDVLADLLAR
jgi:RimJ/RimL family protein N-acetyltransferase